MTERIKTLERAMPNISLSIKDDGRLVSKVIRAEVTLYPPLSQDFLDEAVRAVAEKYPAEYPAVLGPDREKRKRRMELFKERRKAWLEDMRKQIASMPEGWNELHEPYSVSLELRNLGTISANGLLVEVCLRGGICLADRLDHHNRPSQTASGLQLKPRNELFDRSVLFDSPDFDPLDDLRPDNATDLREAARLDVNERYFAWRWNEPRMPAPIWRENAKSFVTALVMKWCRCCLGHCQA
ncbi:hypothetical protein [Lysobacter enzymogenes]|uniref:hypothetical protein n=1 Tax=Lysobacter enzymogenes TaxID=69 RepID=UPI002263CDE2|nr:hypothetical protein [Lysobacter enzymogenes]UZW62837.1 hypothetical protein BV903_011300 [Lysobacter enzymogenes]